MRFGIVGLGVWGPTWPWLPSSTAMRWSATIETRTHGASSPRRALGPAAPQELVARLDRPRIVFIYVRTAPPRSTSARSCAG